MSKSEAIECNECGSLVLNRRKHKEWHERVVLSKLRKAPIHVDAEGEASSARFVGRREE